MNRMVALDSKLLLFGGRTSGRDKFNDVHKLDTETMTWSKETNINDTPPASRGGCSLEAVGSKVVPPPPPLAQRRGGAAPR